MVWGEGNEVTMEPRVSVLKSAKISVISSYDEYVITSYNDLKEYFQIY